MLINGYNIAAEYISKVIILVLIFFMIYSKPRRNQMIVREWIGIVLAFLAIELQINIVYLLGYPEYELMLKTVMFSHFIMYLVILAIIFEYVYYIGSGGSYSLKKYWTIAGSFYGLILVLSIASGHTCFWLKHRDDGFIDMTGYIRTYVVVGMITSLLVLVIIFANRKKITKTLFTYLYVFICGTILFQMLQIHWDTVIMSGISYVLPFLLFYMLFHASPYEEISGCQNEYSLQTRFNTKKRWKSKFTSIYVEFSQLKYVSDSFVDANIRRTIFESAKKIERVRRGTNIHRVGSARYIILLSTNDEAEVRRCMAEIEKCIEDEITKASFALFFKMIAVRSDERIRNTFMLREIFNYALAKISASQRSESYIVTSEDIQEYLDYYKIGQELINICNNGNLDDERVLCYAQPIYCIEDGKFHSAEALMRLKLDGQIIGPDKFIGIAEKNNCIHALTRIMINKVCKQLKQCEGVCDISAITINCTATELSVPHLHEELLAIMDANGVDRSKIRLEMTESMMLKNYDSMLKNMEILRESGVGFYLDDFGTGYSNFDRIIHCNFDVVKFDKSLLYKAMDDEGTSGLVAYLARAFEKRGIITLMEGVESEEQVKFCEDNGFKYIQGFKFAKPIPIEESIGYFK